MDLTNEDVADVLALLDSLPYDEVDLQTTRFRLTLRRTPDGWTQSTQVMAEPNPLEPAAPPEQATGADTDGGDGTDGNSGGGGGSAAVAGETSGEVGREISGEIGREISGAGEVDGEIGGAEVGLVAVRAPLPGTFYRAPRPGAPPFVEVGSQVSADTVIGIVETMKLMNSVPAGVVGTIAEICVANAEFAAQGTTLLLIRADL
jgi:acetyl-CoA carboxylase biotin carboxyl carrier protein